jgi:hypothetical protein
MTYAHPSTTAKALHHCARTGDWKPHPLGTDCSFMFLCPGTSINGHSTMVLSHTLELYAGLSITTQAPRWNEVAYGTISKECVGVIERRTGVCGAVLDQLPDAIDPAAICERALRTLLATL